MSKIGKINIAVPEKVKVALAGNNLNIEGPLGKKSIDIDLDIFNLDIKDGKEISIKPKKIDQNTKRLWGMNRSLINNAVIGSSTGYEKTLELVGVGYRAALKGNQLNLQLGYSHDINFDIPEGIKIAVEKQTTLKITGQLFLMWFVFQQLSLFPQEYQSLYRDYNLTEGLIDCLLMLPYNLHQQAQEFFHNLYLILLLHY